jgi:microcin C transport system substrate-binding protein
VGPDRDGLLHADALLREAGFVVRDGRRVDARSGEPLTIAILYSNHSAMVFNRPYHAALERLGIATTARVVEASQYLQRLRGFDFELTLRPVAPSMIPNSELQNLFGSAAAHQPLTANVGGIADPAVDALIGRVVGAGSMRELTAAVRALDRVLLWNFYMVPGYYPPGIMYVYWNRFGQPRRAGIYRTGYPDTWWFDAERARRIEAGEPIDDVAPD